MNEAQLQAHAAEHGTPLLLIDHDVIRRNLAEFHTHLPKVQVYYAVKANPEPAIIRTLYEAGASFDVASLAEFLAVCEQIGHVDSAAQHRFIRDRIIHANPIKTSETLLALDQYDPLITFDNAAELEKIRRYAPRARLILRVRVPNNGSEFELSSKFGCEPSHAAGLARDAVQLGLSLTGISFHVGSQCTNFDNYLQALAIAWGVMKEATDQGHHITTLDIGGGFPARYTQEVKPFRVLAQVLAAELARLFPSGIRIIAEPGRFLVASSAIAVASIIGKTIRDGRTCYYLDDSIFQTFSGVIFDHRQYRLNAFRKGVEEISTVFGRTCDGLDIISRNESLPELEIGDLVYTRNIGAYSNSTATSFNGFPTAKAVHLNERRIQDAVGNGATTPETMATRHWARTAAK